MFDDDDDDFFKNLGKTRQNLSKIFNYEGEILDGDSKNLKYQPPKKAQNTSSKEDSKQSTTPQWNTKIAKVAVAYKDRIELLGKVGVAYALSTVENFQRLIIYKTKANILGTATLNPLAEQMHLQSGYLQFYDDGKVFWSLHFEKESDRNEFLDALESGGIKVKRTENKPETVVVVNENENLESSSTSLETEPLPTPPPKIQPAGNSNKSAIISRMAKMGGQPLPILKQNHGNLTTEYSDSSDTEVISTKPPPPIMPRSSKLLTKNQLMPTVTTTTIAANPTSGILSQMEANLVQMMLTENRTQNTELRMNISKLETKIEKILDKVDNLNIVNNPKASREDEILELEEKILDLKKENRKLRQELQSNSRAQNSTATTTTTTMNELNALLLNTLKDFEAELQACDIGIYHHVDLRTLLETFLDELKSTKELLRSKDSQLSTELEKLRQLEEQLNQEITRSTNANKQLEELRVKLNATHSENETLKSDKSDLGTRVGRLEAEKAELEKRLEEAKKENEHLKETLNQQQQRNGPESDLEGAGASQATTTESTIKQIMNNLFGTLADNIHEMNIEEEEKIQHLIGKIIRDETLESIKRIKK